MASITIRNLDDRVKQELRVLAAVNGRSMEAEARLLLTESVIAAQSETQTPPRTMGDVMREIEMIVEQAGGFDIEVQKDSPVDFSLYDAMHGAGTPSPSGKAA
jgi:antitoxin FitA